jgi:exopolysaccharide biosynthesis polyprenyl glycosylphosphotransferase
MPSYKKNTIRTSPIFLFMGDAFLYFIALCLVLYIRYQNTFETQLLVHSIPFFILFVWWTALFYINNLYEFEFTKNWIFVIRKVVTASVIATLGSVLIFYFGGTLIGVAPKTNLILFSGLFTFFAILLRLYVVTRPYLSPASIVLIGESKDSLELQSFFVDKYREVLSFQHFDVQKIKEMLAKETPAYIIIDEKEKNAFTDFDGILELLQKETKVITTSTAYEAIFKKIPLNEVTNIWLLEYIHINRMPFDALKRAIDIVGASVLLLLLSPVFFLCILIAGITTGLPIFYTQIRVGKNGKHFTLYKFRTMVTNAEQSGPMWSTPDDPRITKLGKFLRTSHLDELPQLYNILNGTISFVGPRPERPHFVKELTKEIPYFEIRHSIKPGLTGWAQIRHGYTSDTESFFEKFQYDLYYIKNRSIIFDLLIGLKTVRGFMPQNYKFA